MELWIIEPRDPLIARDGRPFGPYPGARARPLNFPFPSTIAGGLRTRAGQDETGRFEAKNIPAIKQIGIRGPLLVEVDDQEQLRWLVPAPADALLLGREGEKGIYRHRLVPLEIGDACCNLPAELSWPVGLAIPSPNKPHKAAPRFWHWCKFADWLSAPPSQPEQIEAAELGHNGPGKEWRMHVAIDPNSFTGAEGALFATGGLEFWHRPASEKWHLSEVKRLALAAQVRNLNGLTIDERLAPLGGERRTMRWWKSGEKLPELDGLPEQIAEAGHCRLILLTPARFGKGWLPTWLLQQHFGVTPKLKAAVVGKPQTVSGWDFEKGSPKPTQRLVPAGSVYFMSLGTDKAAIQQWVKEMWLANVSDNEEDRRAGFGLAALGVWSGTPATVTL